jgi:TetR/AcrR family transcriptional regulator, tetracycline repressor protein
MTSIPTLESERGRLSRAAVVDRALALADAEGLEALTIRRLANELGVTPMALYWHFRSKDELLAGVADRLWGEINHEVDEQAGWPVQLRGLLESLVTMLRAHPCASQLLVPSEKLHGDASRRVTEAALAVLHRAGFDTARASEIARHGLWTGLILVMSDPAFPGFGPQLSDADRAELQRRKLVELAMLPQDQYPHLVAAAQDLTGTGDPEFHYRLGIELYIAGVQAMAPARRPGPADA